ncbi:MAG: hypothetical protein U0167_07720 [bacterium]
MSIALRYMLAWVPMVVIAVANGVLRVTTYGRRMTELGAHQLSTLIGAAVLSVYIWLVVRRWPPSSGGQALRLGAMWVALTVAFECLFGRFVVGRAWAQLFHDYDLLAGRVWALFLIWVGVAPWLFRRVRHGG